MINYYDDEINTTNIHNSLTYQFLLQWHYYLDIYNARSVQTCGSTNLFDDFNISNLTFVCVAGYWPFLGFMCQIDMLKLSKRLVDPQVCTHLVLYLSR